VLSPWTRKQKEKNMTGHIEKIGFCGDELVVVKENEKVLVALKPICAAMDLDWASQHRLIKEDPVLISVVCVMHTTGADGKQYEMLCLPLDYLNGWLFKISAKRYTGARRDAIVRYQKECYRVLAEHFQSQSLSSDKPSKATIRLQTPEEVAREVTQTANSIQQELQRRAWEETGELRCQLYFFAIQRGIEDAEELADLARTAMSHPDRMDLFKGVTMPPDFRLWRYSHYHPATFARVLKRFCNSRVHGSGAESLG
jgi:hypothetical protein